MFKNVDNVNEYTAILYIATNLIFNLAIDIVTHPNIATSNAFNIIENILIINHCANIAIPYLAKNEDIF